MKQALTVVEKKVRNLEKRKGKLDVYKEEFSQGKELNEDQKNAITRYDSVVQSLDLARELQKQFTQIAHDAIKAMKKQAKREQMEKQLHELQRIREILKIQDVLSGMGDDSTREDFLSGQNNAVVLTDDNLDHLDKLYKMITPSHEVEDDGLTYEQQVVAASEHLVGLLDGRNKEILGTTYKELKDLIFRIHDCGYFNQTRTENVANGEEEEVEDVEAAEGDEEADAQSSAVEETRPEDDCKPVQEESGSVLNLERTSPQPQDALEGQNASPDDNSIFSTFTHNQPYTEVISSTQGSFNFLQESQIDLESPHMDPAVVSTHPMIPPTARQYPTQQAAEAFVAQFQSQHVMNEAQLPARGPSPTTIPTPTSTPQASQFVQPVQQMTTLELQEFSQIPTQTFTNQNYVALQTYSTPIYGQIPNQPVSSQPGPTSTTGLMSTEQSATTNISEPKKHFMNVNAMAFESTAFKQHTPVDSPQTVNESFSVSSTMEQPGNNMDDSGQFSSHGDDQAPSGGYPHQSAQQSNAFHSTGRGGSYNGNLSGRGGPSRNMASRARGTTNGYGGNRGGRPTSGYTNGRGSTGTFQGYREGGSGGNYYQNTYSRDNFGGGSSYGSNNFKRGNASSNRGGPRGASNRGGNNMSRGTGSRGGYSKPSV